MLATAAVASPRSGVSSDANIPFPLRCFPCCWSWKEITKKGGKLPWGHSHQGLPKEGTLAEMRADNLNADIKWHVSVRAGGSVGGVWGG